MKTGTDKLYTLTISNPRYWPNGYRNPRSARNDAWDYNQFTSYRELWRQFEACGEDIKAFCDFKNCPLPAPDAVPTFSDFVHLASTLRGWRGID